MSANAEAARAVDILTVFACSLVVALHVWAGLSEEGHLVLRPVGRGTVLVAVSWAFPVMLAIASLVLRRGRSKVAAAALCLVAIDAALLLSV